MDNAKILVSDFHIGLGMAQTATLLKLGADCKLLSFSGSSHYAYKYYTPADFFPAQNNDEQKVISHVRNLLRPVRNRGRIHQWFPQFSTKFLDLLITIHADEPISRLFPRLIASLQPEGWAATDRRTTRKKAEKLLRLCGENLMREVFGSYDMYLVSFPPSLAQFFLWLAEKYDTRLVLNLGHRFNIGVRTRKQNEEMFSLLQYLHEHPRHILACGSDYDSEYTKHYLGFEPVKLPFVCSHLPSSPSPASSSRRPILIWSGNSNQDNSLAEKLNQMSLNRGRENGSKRYTFSTIKNLYQPFRAYEDLQRHPAIIILPYSAFSMLMLELYELNIPFFVPSFPMLKKYCPMYDRPLFPIYCSEREYHHLKIDGPAGTLSPNSYEEGALRHWMQFCFFYRTQNAVLWNSEEDLLNKLANADLKRIRENMSEENARRRKTALGAWKKILLDGQA